MRCTGAKPGSESPVGPPEVGAISARAPRALLGGPLYSTPQIAVAAT